MRDVFFNESLALDFLNKKNLLNKFPYHLSLRQLAVVFLLIQNNSKFIHEIACDHAKLSLFLLENKIVEGVFVSDLASEPLQRAKSNLSHYLKDEKLQIFLSDGLDKHNLKNDDVIVLTGVGGFTAISIFRNLFLANSFVEIDNLYFITQVQSRELEFYHYMNILGAELMQQFFAYENSFLYDIRMYKFNDFVYAKEKDNKLVFPFINKRINDDFYKRLAEVDYKVKFNDLFAIDDELINSLNSNERLILHRYFNKYIKYFSDFRHRFNAERDLIQFIDNVIIEIEKVTTKL